MGGADIGSGLRDRFLLALRSEQSGCSPADDGDGRRRHHVRARAALRTPISVSQQHRYPARQLERISRPHSADAEGRPSGYEDVAVELTIAVKNLGSRVHLVLPL